MDKQKYWKDDRLLFLQNMLANNPKYVVIVPSGRRRFMELLMPHIFQSKLTQEIHLWYNPRNQADGEYIKSLAKDYSTQERPIKIIAPEGRRPMWQINDFYDFAKEENTIYLKVDDDDIYFEPGAIDRIFEFRKEHPEYFVISPLVINNGFGSYMLIDKLQFTNNEYNEIMNECCPQRIPNKLWWYKQANMAIKAHEFLLKNLNNIDEIHVPYQEIDHTRFSINAICWFGKDINNILWNINDDEQNLSCDFPYKLGLKNCMMGNAICAHYAFGPQIYGVDKTDILDRYCQLKHF